MGWYTGSAIDTTNLDAGGDNAGSARAAILAMAQAINAMAQGRGTTDGVASLDSSGRVPEAQLALALTKSGNLAGLANLATARQNLGASAIGSSILTAADGAAVQTLLGFMAAAGGTFSGAPKYAANPGDGNTLARKQYVDEQVALQQAILKVAILADVKGSGTVGGTFTSGAWRVRTLNTEVYDPAGVVTLDAPNNRFTLGAGTYLLLGLMPAFEVINHRARIWNVTDTAALAYSQNARSAANTQTNALLLTVFTIAGDKVYQVEHQCSSTRDTFGFGYPDNFGDAEIYTQIFVMKLA